MAIDTITEIDSINKTHNLLFTKGDLCYNKNIVGHGVAGMKFFREVVIMLKALRKINRVMRAVIIIAGSAAVIFTLIEGRKKSGKDENAQSEVFDDIW